MNKERNETIISVKEQINLIRTDVEDCDNQTPTYAANSMEFISNRVHDGSITETEGSELKEELRGVLEGFKRRCWCRAHS